MIQPITAARPNRVSFIAFLEWTVTRLAILFLLGTAQFAHAQAAFTVSASPTSGTVASGGTLAVSYSGTVKSALNGDTVQVLELMEGSSVLASHTYTVTFTKDLETPVNTTRTVALGANLGVGVHQIFLRAYTYLGYTNDSPPITVTVSAPANVNGAAFVSQSNIPTQMTAGQSYPVSVTMQNTGTTTWSTGPYGLGAQNPQDNQNWISGRAGISGSVAPGQVYTFNFTVTAPNTPGSYNFQWRMLQEYVEWFGGYSSNVPVTVIATPPTANISAPAHGSIYTTYSPTYTVTLAGSGSASAGASISKLEFYESGSLVGSAAASSINISRAFSLGYHILELRATDSRGLTDSTYAGFTVAAPAPVASLSAPSTGSSYQLVSGSTAVVPVAGSGSSPGSATITKLEVLDNGIAILIVNANSVNSSVALPTGTHALQLRATDNAGTTGLSAIANVTVFATPPTVALSVPSTGSTYTLVSGTTVAVPVVGSATPAGGASISQIEVLDFGSPIATVFAASINSSVALSAGSHSLQLRATDSVGTTAVSSTASITVGAPTPAASLTAPDAGSTLVTAGTTATTTVTGSAVATGGSPITKLELLDNGTPVYTANGVSSISISQAFSMGSHNLQLRATNGANAVGLSPVSTINVIAATAGNAAQFISQSVPAPMRAGQPYSVTVKMLNTGTTTWSEASSYRLGAQNPQDARTWNVTGRAYLSAPVATGETATFTIPITAPQVAGTYNFQWQMVREFVAWFGGLTTNLSIPVTVGPGPSATLAVTPTNVRVSGAQTAALTFNGSGSESGSLVTKLELFQANGQDFGPSAIQSSTGAAATLNLSATVNVAAGVYRFKLRSTDSSGVQTDSLPVLVNVTNSALLGTIMGVRSDATGKPQLVGWTCQSGTAGGLPFQVLLDAPTFTAGATLLTSGVADVATEPDNAAIQAQCATPGSGHHFVVDLSTYITQYAGRALYVQATNAAGDISVTLPCADNSCTMPGTLRVGMTTPLNGDQVMSPNPAFLRMQLTNASGTYDEVGFYVNGEWIAAVPDGAPGAYSASKAGLAVSAAPYTVYAKVRQGNTTLLSVQNQFTVVAPSVVTVAMTSPANGASVTVGTPQTLGAVVTGTTQAVKFYANSVLVATGSNIGGTWTASWTPAIAATYSIVARAYDGVGTQLAESPATSVVATVGASGDTPVPIVVDVPQLSNPDAGTLPGALVVTNNGTAGYSMALQVPPGTAGMVPGLSLDYDSGNTTGSAGLGWSLGGFSNIDRCGKTVATDGTADAVRFIAPVGQPGVFGPYTDQPVDRLCLDGKRLVLVNGDQSSDAAYWANNAEYRTEVESFTRVRTLIDSNGKRTFKVETRDGKILYFGDTADSYVNAVNRTDGLAHRWRLSRRADRRGNYISYTYRTDPATGENKPATIRWGGNTANGQSHYAKAAFTFEARPDARTSYVAGSRADERLRVALIETFTDTAVDGSGGVAAQTYSLTYELSPTSGRSLLKTVQACAGTTCLPATTFDWGKPNPSAPHQFVDLGGVRAGPDLVALGGAAANPGTGFSYANGVLSTIVSADFNDDGKTDILERYRVLANVNQQRLFQADADGNGWSVSYPFAGIPGPLAVMETGDFDGDGKLDILVADWPPGQYALTNWRICWGRDRTAAGAYSCNSPVSFPADAFPTFPLNPARMVKDFNADGRDDIFLRSSSTNLPGDMKYMCLSNGTSFDCTSVGGTSDEISFGDMEGGSPSSGSVFADMDGDGRVDHVDLGRCVTEVLYPNQVTWKCSGGNGNGGGILIYGETERGAVKLYGSWFQFPDMKTAVLPPPASGTLTGDLNADGYSDMVFGSAKLGAYDTDAVAFAGNICYSKGNGEGDCRPLPASGLAFDHLAMTVGDFDGDGIMDVLRPGVDSWTIDDIPSYQLCRIGPDASFHRCEAWSGPVFHGVQGSYGFAGQHPEDVYNRQRSMFFGDFNGDGKQDIASYLGGSNWQISGAADQAKPGEALDKLISVTNGIGFVERVEYAAVNDTDVYKTVATFPTGVPATTGKLVYPTRQLVKAAHRSNGRGGWLDTTYRYARYAIDRQGRGSLGFAQVETTDQQSGIVSTTWPWQTFPYIGTMRFAQTKAANGTLLSDVAETRVAVSTAQSNGSAIPYSYVSQRNVKRRDLDGSNMGITVTDTAAPDVWGNITYSKSTSSNDDFSGWTTETTSSYDNDATSWRLGELRSAIEKRTIPASASMGASQVTRTLDFTYDANGMVETETRQNADAMLRSQTRYDRSGNVFGLVNKTILSWHDPDTNTDKTRITSDVGFESNGRFQASATNALHQTEIKQFDSRSGAAKQLQTANNLFMNWVSDGFGRITKVVATDNTESIISQKLCTSNCPAGAAVVIIKDTQRSGVRVAVPTLTFMDSAGHAVRSLTWGFDGQKIATDAIYDSRGRVHETYLPRIVSDSAAMVDALSVASGAILGTRTDYDDLNRVVQLQTLDETASTVTSTVTFSGNRSTSTNAKNQVKTETRDVWGRLWTNVDAIQKQTAYEHDAFGNLTKTTDSAGNVIAVTYDALGRKTDLRDPDLGWIHFDVDPLGQVWQQTSPMQRPSKSTRMKYDDLGRMVQRSSFDHTAGWVYDKLAGQIICGYFKSCGQLVQSYTMTGTVKDFHREHSFDSLGRPATTTTSLDVVYTTQNDYDSWGRPIKETYQRAGGSPKVFDRRYNAYGDLARVERSGLVLWSATAKDAAGRLTKATLGNGLIVDRSYDPRTGRLMHGTLQNVQSMQLQEDYSYDKLGNVAQRTQSWPGTSFDEMFTYDGLNRLKTAAVTGYPTQTFQYDDLGNIKNKTGVGSGDYVYPASGLNSTQPHAVSSIPGLGGFHYDGNGNLLDGAGRTVTWTDFDMPSSISNGTSSRGFVYGADYQRVKQTSNDGTGLATYYAGPIEVETRNGAVESIKTYWPLGLGVEIEKAGSTTLNWTHQDRLGSVVAISDQSGNLIEKLAYDSWGKRRTLVGDATPNSIDGQVDNKGYTGHEMLDTFDLVHMNGRVYDPFIARFMSADPIIQDPRHSQSYNRYTYVWNNPTNLTDPTGFEAASPYAAPDGTCDSRCRQLQGEADKQANNCTGNCVYFGPGRTEQQRNKSADLSGTGNAAPPASEIVKLKDGSKSTWQNMPDTDLNCGSELCGRIDPEPFATVMNATMIGMVNVARETALWELGGVIGGRVIGGVWGWGTNALRTSRAANAAKGVAGIATPYGVAAQSASAAAVAARAEVQSGATLYRIGTMGKSQAAEAQFWALENPLSAGYAGRYGIPAENVINMNFIETATLKPGMSFVTRSAPGIGGNLGGGIEVVTPPNGVVMQSFSGW